MRKNQATESNLSREKNKDDAKVSETVQWKAKIALVSENNRFYLKTKYAADPQATYTREVSPMIVIT